MFIQKILRILFPFKNKVSKYSKAYIAKAYKTRCAQNPNFNLFKFREALQDMYVFGPSLPCLGICGNVRYNLYDKQYNSQIGGDIAIIAVAYWARNWVNHSGDLFHPVKRTDLVASKWEGDLKTQRLALLKYMIETIDSVLVDPVLNDFPGVLEKH